MKGLLFKYFLLAFVLNMGINTLAKEKNTFVKIETNYGTLKVMLYDETPLHRDNFLKLVKENFARERNILLNYFNELYIVSKLYFIPSM